MGSYNQLSLLDDFDKQEEREERLVRELLKEIANAKFLRMNTRFVEFKKREEIVEAFSQVMYWMAWIAYKKSRGLVAFKNKKKLEDFLALTKDRTDISVTQSLEEITMMDFFRRASIRASCLLMVNKDLLQKERAAVKSITENFNLIHDLVHAV